jgi:hypothetical protein
MVCDADHSPPSSTVVTNEWSCTSTPLHAFMHRETLHFPWSWPILLQNPPGRCQENCISIIIVLYMIHTAVSTQPIVSDPNSALVQVTVLETSVLSAAVCTAVIGCEMDTPHKHHQTLQPWIFLQIC